MRLLLLVVSLLTACTLLRPRETQWVNRSGHRANWKMDSYGCERDARWVSTSGGRHGSGSQVEKDQSLYDKCMDAHGWRIEDVPEEPSSLATSDAASDGGP